MIQLGVDDTPSYFVLESGDTFENLQMQTVVEIFETRAFFLREHFLTRKEWRFHSSNLKIGQKQAIWWTSIVHDELYISFPSLFGDGSKNASENALLDLLHGTLPRVFKDTSICLQATVLCHINQSKTSIRRRQSLSVSQAATRMVNVS
jgi:hypothetical protein